MTEFFSSVEFILFAASLIGILLLFLIKKLEVGREHRFAEALRTHADHGALLVKEWIEISEWYLEKTPFFLVVLARYGVHIGALGFARLARTSEEYAHRLAELVSHKRNFERRETKSQFLKEVSEYPIRNSREVSSNGAGKNGNGGSDETIGQL